MEEIIKDKKTEKASHNRNRKARHKIAYNHKFAQIQQIFLVLPPPRLPRFASVPKFHNNIKHSYLLPFTNLSLLRLK